MPAHLGRRVAPSRIRAEKNLQTGTILSLEPSMEVAPFLEDSGDSQSRVLQPIHNRPRLLPRSRKTGGKHKPIEVKDTLDIAIPLPPKNHLVPKRKEEKAKHDSRDQRNGTVTEDLLQALKIRLEEGAADWEYKRRMLELARYAHAQTCPVPCDSHLRCGLNSPRDFHLPGDTKGRNAISSTLADLNSETSDLPASPVLSDGVLLSASPSAAHARLSRTKGLPAVCPGVAPGVLSTSSPDVETVVSSNVRYTNMFPSGPLSLVPEVLELAHSSTDALGCQHLPEPKSTSGSDPPRREEPQSGTRAKVRNHDLVTGNSSPVSVVIIAQVSCTAGLDNSSALAARVYTGTSKNDSVTARAVTSTAGKNTMGLNPRMQSRNCQYMLLPIKLGDDSSGKVKASAAQSNNIKQRPYRRCVPDPSPYVHPKGMTSTSNSAAAIRGSASGVCVLKTANVAIPVPSQSQPAPVTQKNQASISPPPKRAISASDATTSCPGCGNVLIKQTSNDLSGRTFSSVGTVEISCPSPVAPKAANGVMPVLQPAPVTRNVQPAIPPPPKRVNVAKSVPQPAPITRNVQPAIPPPPKRADAAIRVPRPAPITRMQPVIPPPPKRDASVAYARTPCPGVSNAHAKEIEDDLCNQTPSRIGPIYIPYPSPILECSETAPLMGMKQSPLCWRNPSMAVLSEDSDGREPFNSDGECNTNPVAGSSQFNVARDNPSSPAAETLEVVAGVVEFVVTNSLSFIWRSVFSG